MGQTKNVYLLIERLKRYYAAYLDVKKGKKTLTYITRKHNVGWFTIEHWTKKFDAHPYEYWEDEIKKDPSMIRSSYDDESEKEKKCIIDDLIKDKIKNINIIHSYYLLKNRKYFACSSTKFCQIFELNYSKFQYWSYRFSKYSLEEIIEITRKSLKGKGVFVLKNSLNHERNMPCVNLDGTPQGPTESIDEESIQEEGVEEQKEEPSHPREKPSNPIFLSASQILNTDFFPLNEYDLQKLTENMVENGFSKVMRIIGDKVFFRKDLLIEWMDNQTL